MKSKQLIVVAVGAFFAACGLWTLQSRGTDVKIFQERVQGSFTTADEALQLFPKSVADLDARANYLLDQYKKLIDDIISLPDSDRTLVNTVLAYERADGKMYVLMSLLEGIRLSEPNDQLRERSGVLTSEAQARAIAIGARPELYTAFKAYEQGAYATDSLTPEQDYYFTEQLKSFKRNGYDLPTEQFEQVKKLEQEITTLSVEYQNNLQAAHPTLAVSRDALAGVDPVFIDALTKDGQGNYLLGVDYPTLNAVSDFCSVASTRRDYSDMFGNRGYPENKPVLHKILNLRDTYANLLGYASYAQYDLDTTMAKSPDVARNFMKDVAAKTVKKALHEIKRFTTELPDGVVRAPSGKIYSYDNSYVNAQYKKKHYNLDSREIAQYFPMEKTIEGLFNIYQTILGLTFKEVKPGNAWHEDVRAIEVTDSQSGMLRGVIFLDLFPRPNKYTHACLVPVLPSTATTDADGNEQRTLAIGMVLTNFPQATETTPSLLNHNEVTTFFHEFGHAMHQMLGSSELMTLSGTQTKLDFVEMPSQMFEEWMWDKAMLKMVSSHYQTGEPLPDTLIDKMLEAKKLDSGLFVQRQTMLGMLSLEYHEAGQDKDLDQIMHSIRDTYVPYFEYTNNTHLYANFGHLVGYNAKYYGYMWSQVFALDMFERFNKEGLLSKEVGHDLVTKVLALGGSVDPNTLLKDFLGRAPNQDAFLKDLGVK